MSQFPGTEVGATQQVRLVIPFHPVLTPTLTPFGLKRPDITAYLPESLLGEEQSGFPQWQVVIREWERQGRPSFKEFVLSLTEVDLRENRTVRRLVEIMRERNLEPHPELRQRVSEIVALADVQRLVPAEQAAFPTDD